MANILITGNGFDLAHGLKTRYGHFIDHFKKHDLKDHPIHNNPWFKYFSHIKNIVTWIDFEEEISKALKMVSTLSDYAIKKQLDKLDDSEIFHVRGILNESDVQSLTRLGVINPSDDRRKVKSNYYCAERKCFLNNTINDDLLNELNDFSIYLAKYLYNIVILFREYSRPLLVGKSLLEKYDQIHTFNYTEFISELYEKDKSEVRHLHGTCMIYSDELSYVLKEPAIVLGVNEITKEQKECLGVSALGFTKYYQTIYKSCDTGALYNLQEDFTQPLSFTFWGHSLDKSDKKYIEEVFKIFENHVANYTGDENDANNITIYWHNSKSRGSMLKNLLDIIGQDRIEKLAYSKKLVFEPSPDVFKS